MVGVSVYSYKISIYIYILTVIGLSPGGSKHLRTNNTQNNTNNNRKTQITNNVEECGPCPVFASFTLAFALRLRKKYGKTSVRVRKTSVRVRKTSVRLIKTSVSVQYTYYQNTHTLQNPQKHTHYKTHTHTHTHTHTYIYIYTYTHITKQYKTTTIQIKINTEQDIPK